jgi:hypothetical protein
MYEDVGTIINKGFSSWVRNLNICIPFVLSLFFNMVLYILLFGLMGFLIFSSNSDIISDPAALSSLSNTELLSMLWEGLTENILLSALLIFVFFLIGIFVQSFFTAGAIGMAKRASETGDTTLSDMLTFGSKNMFRLFLAILLLSLLTLGGIVFLVPGALTIGDLSTVLENPEASVSGIGILGIGIILWSLYMAALSIVLALTEYALVIDELEPLEALSESYRFFKENKMDVLLIWILYLGLTLINTVVSQYAGSNSILVSVITNLFPVVILQPVITVLWTRLYVSRKGRKLYDPSDLLYGLKGF